MSFPHDRLKWSPNSNMDCLTAFSHIALVEQSPNVCLLYDKNLRFLSVNKAFLEKWNLRNAEEVLGRTLEELFASTMDREQLEQIQATNLRALELAPGEYSHYECEFRLPDNSLRTYECRKFPVHDGQGALVGVGVIATDVTERVHAHQALAQSEDRLRALAEASFEAILACENGAIVECNSVAEELFGLRREELLGRQTLELLVPADRRNFVSWRENCSQARLRAMAQRADGNVCPVRIQCRTISYRGRDLRFLAIRDVSERMMAQREIEEREERLRTLINAMPDIVCFKDEEGRWLLANDADLELFSLEHVDYHGKTDEELAEFSPFHREAFLTCAVSDRLAWKTGKMTRSIETIPLVSGGERIFDIIKIPLFFEDGRPKGLMVLGRDVTEIKQAEESLRKSEASYRLLAENAEDVIYTLDRDRGLTYASPSLEKLLGLRPAEALGMFFPDSMENGSRHVLLDGLDALDRMAAQNPREAAIRLELLQRRVDDSLVWVESILKPLLAENSEVEGYLGLSRNIDQRKQIEFQLYEAKEAAEAASLAKSAFLANMSHEIRTPLNGIMGMLQLLELSSLDEEQVGFVRTGMRSARRLLQLISDVLDLSRLEASMVVMRDEPLALCETLNALCEAFQEQAKTKGLVFESWIDEELRGLPLRGDSTRIRQALFNLLGNAIKFTESGFVRLSAKRLPYARKGEVNVLFQIEDSGIGIHEDLLGMIFEPFTQADISSTKKYQGSGLGLRIVQRIAELMGGRITINSELGQGTEIFMKLPLRLDNPERRDAPTREEPVRILVVEDEESHRQIMRFMLQRLGCEAHFATNGVEALQALRQNSFQLVFMDILMPVMDGMETARAIRASEQLGPSQNIPIVALTIHGLSDDRGRYLAMGMDECMSKPVKLSDIRRILAQFLPQAFPGGA